MPCSFSRSSPFLTCRFLSQCVTLSQTRFVASNTWQHKRRDHREHGKHCFSLKLFSASLLCSRLVWTVGLLDRPCFSRQGDMINWFLLYSCRNLSNNKGFLLPESSPWLNDWLNFYSAATQSASAGQYQPNVSACVDDLAHVSGSSWECCTVPGSSLGTLWGFNGWEDVRLSFLACLQYFCMTDRVFF